uniref:Solute carrier family 7 member 10a n=1 Tax=Hucho hucho TaxID=62062 RepID=A0A4W5K2D5_9TELE
PSVGQIALAFLQASFAFSGWNFLNYVTEEVVEPRNHAGIQPTALVLLASRSNQLYTHQTLFSFLHRLCFSGAREGHLPYLLAMIHLKNCTPIPALLVCVSYLILCIGETHNLINYVSFINFLSYGVTIAGLLFYRWKRPNLLRPIKVSVLVPISYLVFWAVLLGFSLYSEPVVCGMGIVIMLTGVPVYFVGVHWKNKPKCVYRVVECVTYVGQKLCFVVFPQEDLSEITPLTASNKHHD